ncbi:MAG: HupE/UreJ family protein, partial [Myxococcota bacterium]
IALHRGGRPCRAVAGPVVNERRDERDYLVLDLRFDCGEATGPFTLRDDTVFPDDAQHEAFVTVGEEEARILRRGRQEVELGSGSAISLVVEYLFEGAIHLITGYDHVLFLLALLLPSGLLAVESGVRATVKDVALLVTAFTVGHSITLAIAALDVVVLPSQPVEVAIAGSIVIVAVYSAVVPAARRAVPWVALGFGLVHGFGFSSVLKEQGLSTGTEVLALLSFNVGIELAQLAVVALVVPLLAQLAKYDRYETVVVRGGSVLIGLLALYWVVERVLG